MEKIETSNQTQAFFNFIKTLVGIAILDLPYAANQCGYVLACILFIFISYGTIRTTLILIDIADQSEYHTYTKIVKKFQGRVHAQILDLALCGQQLFSCIAYIIFFQYSSGRALYHLNIQLHPAVNLIISLVIVIPLSLVREVHFFHRSSTIGLILAVFTLISVVILSWGEMGKQNVDTMKPWGLFSFVGVGMFAYEGICTALPVRYSMTKKEEFNRVFILSSLICLGMYISFMVINCLAYGNELKGIILFNLADSNFAFVIEFIYAISILLTYPVQIHPAFNILEKRFGNKEQKHFWILIRLSVTIILYFIAYFVPNFSTFLNLIGVIFGTILQFWFPITLRLLGQLNQMQKIESYALLSFGLFTGIVGFYFTVIDIYLQYNHD